MTDEKKYTKVQFGQSIKAKYPQYKDLSDIDLADKILAKYPQYQSSIIADEVKKNSSTPVSSQPAQQRTTPSAQNGVNSDLPIFDPSILQQTKKTVTQSDFKDVQGQPDVAAYQQYQKNAGEYEYKNFDPEVVRKAETEKLKNTAIAKQESIFNANKERNSTLNAVKFASELPELKTLNDIDAQITAIGQPQTQEQVDIYNNLVKKRDQLLDTDVSERDIFKEQQVKFAPRDASSFDTASEYVSYQKQMQQAFYDFDKKKQAFDEGKSAYVGKTKLRDVLGVANESSLKADQLTQKIQQEQKEADLAIQAAQELNKGKLEKLGFYGGFEKGMESTTVANTVADFYATGNDEQLAKSLENIYTDAVVLPQESTGAGSVGEVLGGQVKPLAVGIGTSALNPTAGVVAGSLYYGRLGLGGGLIDAYTTARSQGRTQPEALEIAKKQAISGGIGGLAEGAAGAITMGGKPLAQLATMPFKTAVKEALVDNGVDAIVAGANQIAQNKSLQMLGLDRDLSEGVVENMAAELAFGAGMNLAMYGGSKIKGYGTIINGIAKLPLADMQTHVDGAVKAGVIDAAKGQQVINDVQQSKTAQEKLSAVEIPAEQEDKAIELQKNIDLLEEKKKNASPAVLPAIETQIADNTSELQTLLAIPLSETERLELNKLQTARDTNKNYDAQKLSALEARQKVIQEKQNTQQNAKEQQSGTLRNEGEQVQTEGGSDSSMSIVNQTELQDGQSISQEEIVSTTEQPLQNEEVTTTSQGADVVTEGTTTGGQQLTAVDTATPNVEQVTPDQTQVETNAAMGTGEDIPIDEERVSGIKKDLIPEDKQGKVELDKLTVQQALDLGKSQVDNGEVNARVLTEGIAKGKGRALQPNEVAALVYYKTQLDNQLDAANKKLIDAVNSGDTEAQQAAQSEVDVLTDDLNNYYSMSEKTAYEQGLAFRLRQMLLDSEYSLVKQINKYKATNKGTIPPEVEAQFNELSKKLQEVESRLRIVEEERANQEAQRAVDNIAASVKREKKPTYSKKAKTLADKLRGLKIDKPTDTGGMAMASIVPIPTITSKEWNLMVESAANAIEKAGTTADDVAFMISKGVEAAISTLQATGLYKGLNTEQQQQIEQDVANYFNQQAEIEKPVFEVQDGKLKVPNKLLRDLVASGVTNIDDLTKQVYDLAKADFPDITERDVRDAITGYGKTVNTSKDEVSVNLREAKAQGRLISAYEDAEKGLRPLKSGQQRDKQSAKVKELQKKVKDEMRKQGIKFDRANVDPEEQFRTALESYKERTRTSIQDYERRLKEGDYEREKKKPLELDKEAEDLKAERERIKFEFDVEQEKSRLKNRSYYEQIKDGIVDALNVPKSILASADFSAPLRQGAILSAVNPTKVPKAIYDMFASTFSKGYSERLMANIKASDAYPLMKQSGLFLAEPTAKMNAREEQFISNMAEKIPLLGKVIKRTGMGYNGYLNSIRASVFADGATTLKNSGFDPKKDSEIFSSWAGFINNASGRGNLGELERYAGFLNATMFSPRYLASRVNLLNPVYYYNLPPAVRKLAAKNIAAYAGMLGIAYLLAGLSGDELEFDPRSSDALKIKRGTRRLDLAAGFAQVIRFVAQFATGERKRTDTGEIVKLDGTNYKKENRWDVLDNFLRTKYNPTLGAVRNIMEGEDLIGNKTDLWTEVKKLFVPLGFQGFTETIEKKGIGEAMENLAWSSFGGGVQDYSIGEGKNKANEPKGSRRGGNRSGGRKGVNRAARNAEIPSSSIADLFK